MRPPLVGDADKALPTVDRDGVAGGITRDPMRVPTRAGRQDSRAPSTVRMAVLPYDHVCARGCLSWSPRVVRNGQYAVLGDRDGTDVVVGR